MRGIREKVHPVPAGDTFENNGETFTVVGPLSEPEFIRLANRWGLSENKTNKKVSQDLMKLFPKKKWRKLHCQLIDYGRKYCKARGHDINKCYICKNLSP